MAADQKQILMKQPALGKKIAELRKSRGMTQEELVDRCNISVRTIQRIETGEVTPRSYTVKSILDALDYDLGSIANEKEGQSLKWLQYAMIAGIIYFVLGFPESIMEVMSEMQIEQLLKTSKNVMH